jgi:glycosyltransferase involved in cell wall biosynthesis
MNPSRRKLINKSSDKRTFMTISIAIPVLNEEATLNKQITELSKFVAENFLEFSPIEIVIADNGSTDSTFELAYVLARNLDNVRVIKVDGRGVGRALKAAWLSSSADIIGYMDLDLATDLSALKPALQALIDGGTDLVTGSRLMKGSQVKGRSVKRNITSRVFNYIVKFIFRTKFSDGMCGFKFLRRSCLETLMAHGAQSDGWFFATELLVTAESCGYRIKDMPVTWTDDPASKVRIGALTREYLLDIFRLKSNLRNAKPTSR